MKLIRFLAFIFYASGFAKLCIADGALLPKAKFSKQSISVGEPVTLSLSVQYPSSTQILFPDSTFIFAPFELLKKEYYPTISRNGVSKDSVIYFLTTFSLDSIQSIQLPIFQFTATDSTEWPSNRVTVTVNQVFKGSLPNKPVFPDELSVHEIPQRFNYPYILIGMAIMVAILLGANFFFNRPIQRFIYLFIERRRHEAYIRQFDKVNAQLSDNLSIENMEKIINIWKKYIQRVDAKPYTTFTSAEIYKVLPDLTLKESLQEIDRWIYGGVEMNNWQANIAYIKSVSLQLYQQKREAIRNGKFE